MAQTRINAIRRRYADKINQSYQEFKGGKKRGNFNEFKKTEDYKKINSAKNSAIYRYRIQREETDIISSKSQFQNTTVIDSGSPYFSSLDYGLTDASESDKIAMAQYDLSKETSDRFRVLIDASEIGIGKEMTVGFNDFQREVRKIYRECRKIQTKEKIYPKISVVVGERIHNGKLTEYMLLKVEKF